MSSRMVVRKSQEEPVRAPIKIWWVIEELKRKRISQTEFAKALGISVGRLNGRSPFPVEKADECMNLLENWTGPTTPKPKGGRKNEVHPWRGNYKEQ